MMRRGGRRGQTHCESQSVPNCLTLTDFEQYSAGRLDAEAEERFREHIDACDVCRISFDRFKADQDFLDDAKSALSGESELAEASVGSSPGSSSPSSPKSRASRHLPRIDGYRITGVLGQGGMGIVYRAVQDKLNRTVALKVLPAMIGAASPSTVARFRREAMAAARLHHIHIVPIYDFGESPDAYFYAMELIVGQPLNLVIKSFAKKNAAQASAARLSEMLMDITVESSDASSPSFYSGVSLDGSGTVADVSMTGRARHYYRQAALWMADTADALHYAHQQKIIHRDVKPANLIVSTDGRIMVADFGLAKSTNEESVTMTGSFLGTVRYVSPEQAMARRIPIDHRTDIYSLGATMYELLCFQPAFPGTDEKMVLSAVITRDPTSPRKIASSVPHELETICLKAMEKAPDMRYPTARAMGEDLRRYMEDLPIEAKPPGPVTRAIKFVRRRKAATIATTASVFLAVAVPSLIIINNMRSEAFRQKAEAKRLELSAKIEETLQQARTYERIGDWSNAASKYEEVIEYDPNSFRAFHNYAGMLKDQYNVSQDPALLEFAIAYSAKALSIESDHPHVWNMKGVMHKKLGEFEKAITCYKKAIELASDNPDFRDPMPAFHENLGTAHALNGNVEEARKHLLHAGSIQRGKCETIWCSLTSIDLLLDRATAASRIENAFECDRESFFAALVRARVRLMCSKHLDPTGALKDMEFADRKAEPGPAWKRLLERMIGLAYLRNDQPAAAIDHAFAAIKAGDMKTINHLVIALAKVKTGDRFGARQALDDARVHWPTELLQPRDYLATAPEGVLWLELADEMLALQAEADKTLASSAG